MAQQDLLARLAHVLARTASGETTALRFCMAFTELVAADGGSILIGQGASERYRLCSTDAEAARLEDAQDILGDGPSISATLNGLPVTGLSVDEQRDRWPLLVDLLEQHGPPPVMHAFPLRPESTVLGVVSVYSSSEPGIALGVDEAQFLANAVGVALLGQLTAADITGEGWRSRDQVDHATGMVVAQIGIAPEDAVAVLRAHAFAHGTSLAQVSSWVLTRDLDFSRNDEGSDR